MRISCNGCKVLRKGCSEDCSLRPCLEWLKSAEAQANATLFLAKFYGRARLINLINAAAAPLRPEIFRSLLHEACGRIINPVYGSLGLMSSGDWPRCQAAVEAVLGGGHLPAGDDSSTGGQFQITPISPLHGCDVRLIATGSAVVPRGLRTPNHRKRSASLADSTSENLTESAAAKFAITGWDCGVDQESSVRAPSHDSFSVETVEPRLMKFEEPPPIPPPKLSEVELELTLGRNPVVVQISDSEE